MSVLKVRCLGSSAFFDWNEIERRRKALGIHESAEACRVDGKTQSRDVILAALFEDIEVVLPRTHRIHRWKTGKTLQASIPPLYRDVVERSVRMNRHWGKEMGKRKLSVRMWGYLPAASLHRAPLLQPTIVPQTGLLEEVRSVGGGGCGFGLAITESGKISKWGSTNDLGQSYCLRGSPQELKKPYLLDVNANIVQVAGGWAHSVAVTDQGDVCTWGWNNCIPTANLAAEQGEGALAMSINNQDDDVIAPSSSPGPIMSDKVDDGLQQGGVLGMVVPTSDGTTSVDENVMAPPSFVSLAPGVIITSVAAGGRHTLALSDAGKVWGWGCGGEGQLGLGCRLHMTSTPQHIEYLEASHWTSNESSNQNIFAVAKLTAQTFGKYVTRITCGGRHSAVVTDAGAVFSFGWGLYGQCGQGNTEDQLRPVYVSALGGIKVTGLAAGLWHTVFVTDTGDVYASGGNQFGQLGTIGDQAEMLPTLIDAPVLENEFATAVSCGARHTAVLTDKGKIFCWGWNKYGQLGIGDTVDRDTPAEVPLQNTVARDMACGWWHTLALVEEES